MTTGGLRLFDLHSLWHHEKCVNSRSKAKWQWQAFVRNKASNTLEFVISSAHWEVCALKWAGTQAEEQVETTAKTFCYSPIAFTCYGMWRRVVGRVVPTFRGIVVTSSSGSTSGLRHHIKYPPGFKHSLWSSLHNFSLAASKWRCSTILPQGSTCSKMSRMSSALQVKAIGSRQTSNKSSDMTKLLRHYKINNKM